jgi:hypothetical protein
MPIAMYSHHPESARLVVPVVADRLRYGFGRLRVDAASLASGASAKFAITVQASAAAKALVVATTASQNPDPRPLNNISLQEITVIC